MFNISEYQTSSHRLSDLLPWAALVAPGIVLNKDGAFQQSILFRPPDMQSSSEEIIQSVASQLNNAFKSLSAGWSIFVEASKKGAVNYPDSSFPDPASRLLDAERKAYFEKEKLHFESRYILTLVYLPPREDVLHATGKFVEQSHKQGAVDYQAFLQHFQHQTDKLFQLLKGVFPYVKQCNDQETLTYLHTTISSKEHKVTVPEAPIYLDAMLCDEPLQGGLEPKLGEHYVKTISVASFPARSFPGILDGLDQLSLEYRWMTRFILLDKQEALKEIGRYRKRWFAKRKHIGTLLKEAVFQGESVEVDSDALNKAQDADAAMQLVADDQAAFGYYTSVVTVLDRDREHAIDKIKQVERVFHSSGFTTIQEQCNAIQAWLSGVPGHCNANVRRPLVHTFNLAHLLPLSAVWAGPEHNNHLQAPPLFHAVTSGSTPFRFVNHVGDVGHMMVLGPTGAGKSVFLSFMAMQFLRYADAQIFLFDKGYSAKVTTMAVGGNFYDIASGEQQCHFQPLRNIDIKEELLWAVEWLGLLFEQESVDMVPVLKQELAQALKNLAECPKHQRTLSGLLNYLQDFELRKALEIYTVQGPYGLLLDASSDGVLEGNWQCFEMEHLMALTQVVPLVLGYLFHRCEQRFDGRPSLLILDEAWLFLDHPIFALKMREWLKVLRKSNVSVVFATQSIADMMQSNIAATLIESCPTRVFLPNERAEEQEIRHYYQQCGLGTAQITLLAQATRKKEYYIQSPEGNRLIELGLHPIACVLCAASGKDDQKLATKLQEDVGDEGFLSAYFKAKGLDWVSTILQTEEGESL